METTLARLTCIGVAIPLLLLALEHYGDAWSPDLGLDGSSFAQRRRALLEARRRVWLALALLFALGTVTVFVAVSVLDASVVGAGRVHHLTWIPLLTTGIACSWRARKTAKQPYTLPDP
jgi:hypothetical protein